MADGSFAAVLEITTALPGAADAIARLKRTNSERIVGAGTVLDMETAPACLGADADFLTSPGLDPDIVALGSECKVLVIPGALTSSEVTAARKAWASLIKIFPCSLVGGAGYVKGAEGSVSACVAFVASGGVNQQNAGDLIRAGAFALGIGEDLVPHEAVHRRNLTWIHELRRRFIGMVEDPRKKAQR
jgi:2-dehydro-3-deoxyphosphogluconate aldolase/(4S)-4-hydroxy-2-oxoglutarate aldolase